MTTDETFCHITQPYGAVECRVDGGPNLGALLGVEKGGRFYEVFTNFEGVDKLKRVSESHYRNQFPLK